MASFGATRRMDYSTMADLIEVRSRPGLHYDFQLGIKIIKTWKKFVWPTPLYNGCAARAFFFSGENLIGGMKVWYSNSYFLNPNIEGGKVYNDFSNDYTSGRTGPKTGFIVEKNTYFSLGVIIQDRSLGFMFGNKVLETHNMHGVIGYVWYIMIPAGPMLLTSFHIYDEVSRHFPAAGLGNGYVSVNTWRIFQTPIGSSVTVELVYKGDPNESVTVQLEEDGPVARYSSVPLNKDDVFTVIVENTINGWDVTVSFEGPSQTPRFVQRKSVDYHTRPTFSNNCSTIRILAVCAPIPTHHRE